MIARGSLFVEGVVVCDVVRVCSVDREKLCRVPVGSVLGDVE